MGGHIQMRTGKTFHTAAGYNGGELSITSVWFPMQILAVEFSVWLQITVYPSHTPQSSFTLWKHFCLSVQCNDQLPSHPPGPSETWSETGEEREQWWERMKRGREHNKHFNVVTSSQTSATYHDYYFFSPPPLFWSESSALKSLN